MMLALWFPLFAALQGSWARGLHFPGLHSSFPERAEVALEYDDHSGEGPALFVGGRFDGIGTELTSNLARWHGDRWSSLPATPNGVVTCLQPFDDGHGEELFVGGTFTSIGGLPVHSVAAWNGASWRAIGDSLGEVVFFLVHDDGGGPALYALNRQPIPGFGSYVARWDGQNWQPVGSSFGMDVRAAWSVPAGSGRELIVDFIALGQHFARFFGRWNGTDWEAVDLPPGNWSIRPPNRNETDFLAVDESSGDVQTYSNGAWHSLGNLGAGIKHFARIDVGTGSALYALNEDWHSDGYATITAWLHDGTQWQQLFQHANLPPLGHEDTLLAVRLRRGPNDVEFIGGGSSFSSWGSAGSKLAMLASDGMHRPGVGQGLFTSGLQGTVFDSGSGPALYVPSNEVTQAGQSLWRMKRHDGRGWTTVPVLDDPNVHFMCSTVYRDPQGTALWVGRLTPSHSLLRFDGTNWSEPFGSVQGPVSAIGAFDLGSGPELCVAGAAPLVGSPSTVSKWNGTSWTGLGPAGGGYVEHLAAFDDGGGPALFAAGVLWLAPPIAEPIARWNGTSWSRLGSVPLGQLYIRAVQVHDDGTGEALYIAGQFQSVAGVPAQGIARWNGTSWSGLGGACNGAVTSLTVFDDGTGPALYATGSFTQIGGGAASHLARWNGTSWSEFGGGLHSMPGHGSYGSSLVVFDDHLGGGPTLCVFGWFQRAGDVVSVGFARWGRVVGAPSSFCDGSGDTTITPCPCNNHGARGRGCANSANALGAALGTTGSNLDDSLVLVASGLPGATTCVFLQGTESGDAPFGDGVLCLGGAIVRVALRSASAGVCTLPNASDTLTLAQMGGVQVGSGAIRRYQTYYRNGAASFCPPASFNATNGVEVGW
ncbi:MAG: hypothetical protein IPJ77_09870 [Planctomycetes bacterium]|nr:hypothetical protein [Planctomycetota bacterium]